MAFAPDFDEIAMTEAECSWLARACPFFSKDYLDYLKAYRFKPSQVTMSFIPASQDAKLGQIEIDATGPWLETILWEVPLMACLSELYFRTVDTDWSYEGQEGKSLENTCFKCIHHYKQKTHMIKQRYTLKLVVPLVSLEREEDEVITPKILL
jgi:nicotinic acid phosphoribosyltransferase